MSSVVLLKPMLVSFKVLNKSREKMKVKMKTSKKSDKLDRTLCRICYDEKGEIEIFNNLNMDVPTEIKNFTGVIIHKSNNLPEEMCQSCMDLLNGCIMFRDMCQRTNKKFVELTIKKEEESKDIISEIKEDSDEDSCNIPSPTHSDNSDETMYCNKCDNKFLNTKLYRKHIPECNKQQSEKPKSGDQSKPIKGFLCDICGKTTRSNASLLTHMGIHGNVFPFICDQCPYQGRTMDLLKIHKRTHMADKPFKCSQCPKSTTTASNLAKHMRHVHSNTRPFKCTYCDKAFSYQHDMKRHVRDIHLRQGTVQCDLCFKKFNTKKILQGHRYKIHKIKGERQGRLPSYLQCQTAKDDNNVGNYDVMNFKNG